MILIKRIFFILILLCSKIGLGQFSSSNDTLIQACVKGVIQIETYHSFDTTITFKLNKKTNNSAWIEIEDSLLVTGNTFVKFPVNSANKSLDSNIFRFFALDTNNQIVDSSRQFFLQIADSITTTNLSQTIISQCENLNDTLSFTVTGDYYNFNWVIKKINSSWDTITSSLQGFSIYDNSLVIKLDSNLNKSKLILNSSNVCNSLVSDTVNIEVLSNTKIRSKNISISGCTYDTLSYEFNFTGNNLSYHWFYQNNNTWDTITGNFNNGYLSGYNSNKLYLFDIDTQYYSKLIKVEASGQCGSTQFDTATINVVPNPSVVNSPRDTTVCEGLPVIFEANINGLNKSYHWQVKSSGTFRDISSSDVNYVNINSGKLTVLNKFNGDTLRYFRLKYSATCLDSGFTQPIKMEILQNPRIHFYDTTLLGCEGDITKILSKSTGSQLTREWELTTKKGQSLKLNSQNYLGLFSQFNSDTLSINGLDELLDSSMLRLTVSGICLPDTTSEPLLLIVDTKPYGIANSDKKSICSYDSVILKLNSISGKRIIKDWEHIDAQNNWVQMDSNFQSFSLLGDGSLKVYGVDSTYVEKIRMNLKNKGCGNYTTNIINLNLNKVDTLTYRLSKETICLNEQANLKLFGLKGLSIYPNIETKQIQFDSFLLAPKKSTNYLIQYEDKNSCKGLDSFSIIVNSLPDLDHVNNRFTNCLNDTGIVEFTNLMAGTTVEWDFSGELLNSNNSQLFYTTNNLIDTLKIVGLNNSGCVDSVIEYIYSNVNPELSFSGDIQGCIGAYGILNASGADKYYWYNENQLIDSTIVLEFKFVESFKHVKIKGMNRFGCTDSLVINITPRPNPGLFVEDKIVCKGSKSYLNIDSDADQIEYFPIHGIIRQNDSLFFNGITSNTYLVSAKNNFGCARVDTLTVEVVDPIKLQVPKVIHFCDNHYAIININYNGINRVEWESTEGLDYSDTFNVMFRGEKNRINRYRSIDTNSCIYFDSIISIPLKSPNDQIIGDSVFCKNQKNLAYKATSNFNSIITWQVSNADIIKEAANRMLFINSKQDSIVLKLQQSIEYPEFNCTDSFIFIARPSKGDASEFSKIQTKSMGENTLLLIPVNQSLKYYRWGRESKLNNIEVNISQNKNWLSINSTDTTDWVYWLKSGNDSNCLNKEYYSFNFTNSTHSKLNGFKTTYFKLTDRKIEIVDYQMLKNLFIYNSNGQLVSKINRSQLINNKGAVDLSLLSSGMYYLRVSTQDNQNLTERLFLE